ncbi:PAS domain-containing protein [Hymenobacter monticola]|uniref:PAS domain-containing protein n=1 Tax=Hymenobacter monticola TaxID=1705399 RepID=A0ABY4BAB0_9BACT|nr:PAS domain-containing protein [Hymenobacter monticola]UOE35699.1 PAS domain-containing protein [Hymenobacter monticola]
MPAPASDLLSVFSALPSACVLLSPDFVIEAASDSFVAVTGTPRANMLGRHRSDVFPDNPNDPTAHSVADVQAALERVLATGQPNELPAQRYALPDPEHPGQFVEHYWQARNTPVLDEQGRVTHLIQTVVNITAETEAAARLHDAQVREQAAREAADWQRSELSRIFEQAPVAIATYRGSSYTIEFANPLVCELWGRNQADIIGKGLFEALPEVAGMGYEELLDGVMATGEPYVAHGMEAQHDRNGQRETVYWDFVYVPLYEDNGSIYGAMVVATEVTEQVQARQKIQELNTQLAAVNQALQESNAELLTNQEEVLKVQQLLEGNVAERTKQLQSALAEAEQHRINAAQQQLLLSQILGQTPAGIATLTGPEHRFSFMNEHYQDLSGNRARVGLTAAEVFPEALEQGFIKLLDQVYATGEPFQGRDMPVQLTHPTTGQQSSHYIDFSYQPLRNEQGQTLGILAFIVEVTDRTLTRQQAETQQGQPRDGQDAA